MLGQVRNVRFNLLQERLAWSSSLCHYIWAYISQLHLCWVYSIRLFLTSKFVQSVINLIMFFFCIFSSMQLFELPYKHSSGKRTCSSTAHPKGEERDLTRSVSIAYLIRCNTILQGHHMCCPVLCSVWKSYFYICKVNKLPPAACFISCFVF